MKRLKWLGKFVTSARFMCGVSGAWLIDSIVVGNILETVLFGVLVVTFVVLDEVQVRHDRAAHELEVERARVTAIDPRARVDWDRIQKGTRPR